MSQNNNIFLVALGSNMSLGKAQPAEIIRNAVTELIKFDINLISLSRLYETPAFPERSGPNFINSVVKVECNYSPHEILKKLHQIEQKFDRQRASRWSARTLDLDLLAFKGHVFPSRKIFQQWFDLPISEQKQKVPHELILPHPRMQDRAFVLFPLLDIEPKWKHPVLKKTVLELYEELPNKEKKNIQIVQ